MAKRLYRLMSGKIARIENGVNVVHKAPWDFLPTQDEYAANKFRLKAVGWEKTDNAESTERSQALEAAIAVLEPFILTLPDRERDRRLSAVREAIVSALRDEGEPEFTAEPVKSDEPISANIPENSRKSDEPKPPTSGIVTLSQRDAMTLVASVDTETELDRLLLEESGSRGRMKVIAAIEKRRDEIRQVEDERVRADAR